MHKVQGYNNYYYVLRLLVVVNRRIYHTYEQHIERQIQILANGITVRYVRVRVNYNILL